MASRKNFAYTHRLYKQGIEKLTNDIKQSGIKFDYLVGVARGGAIPAVHLSHTLDIPVEIIHWSTFGSKRMLYPDNDPDYGIKEDLQDGKSILLVDDIIDNGKTIRQLLTEWSSNRFFEFVTVNHLKVASLIYNPENKSRIKADFYHIEYPKKYVDFWWEN